MVILVAAASENDALGNNNELIWHLPDDFRRFKQITSGHSIIMGRKTFESFPSPLPNRTHIVITRQKDYHPEGCIVVHSLEDAFKEVPEGEDSYVIGGGEIFEMSMADADKIELTRIHANFDNADAFFPKIDDSKWNLIGAEEHPIDDRHNYGFTYLTYVRK